MTTANKCEWKDDGDGNWWTSCGEVWNFLYGGPTGNGMNYCPFCGKLLVDVLNQRIRSVRKPDWKMTPNK